MQVLHCFPVLVTLKPVFPHKTPVATLLKKLTQSSPVTTGSFKLLKKGWGLTGNLCELFIVKKKSKGPAFYGYPQLLCVHCCNTNVTSGW